MKIRLILVATAAAMAAGPALAQRYDAFAPGAKPKTSPSFGAAPAFPAPPKPPSPPPAPVFKPYEPYKASSVYSAPKAPKSGAKDCELSVYVNACGRRR